MAACAAYLVVITAAFIGTLGQLLMLAVRDNLHSHIPLVPMIVAYLLYTDPRHRAARYANSIPGALIAGAVGAIALGAAAQLGQDEIAGDRLSLMTLAYLAFVAAGGFLFLGVSWMKAAAFPVSFLLFMIPLPGAVVAALERGLVQGSTETAVAMFRMTGTPLLHSGTILALPGITLEVARQCSGIHSSWTLFITSLLASYLFVRSPWRRLALVVFVIPLGIARNAFRILVLGLLCVHVGPHMIDSAIHRRGGPAFFVLSLVPLLALLAWFRRQERRRVDDRDT